MHSALCWVLFYEVLCNVSIELRIPECIVLFCVQEVLTAQKKIISGYVLIRLHLQAC